MSAVVSMAGCVSLSLMAATFVSLSSMVDGGTWMCVSKTLELRVERGVEVKSIGSL